MADGSKQRASGYTAVAGLLSHPDTTRFISSVEAFIARRGRRNALPGTELRRLTEPASSFAAECLERLRRRVMKRGKAMLDLPPEQRHDRRIALKNLLYTADFFGDLFGHGSTVTSYTKVAARLQDALGSFNNMVMVIDQVARLDTHDADPARAAGIVIGWYGHGARIYDTSLRNAWLGFRKAKRFWKHALTDPEQMALR